MEKQYILIYEDFEGAKQVEYWNEADLSDVIKAILKQGGTILSVNYLNL